jgi:hypothetical protein
MSLALARSERVAFEPDGRPATWLSATDGFFSTANSISTRRPGHHPVELASFSAYAGRIAYVEVPPDLSCMRLSGRLPLVQRTTISAIAGRT